VLKLQNGLALNRGANIGKTAGKSKWGLNLVSGSAFRPELRRDILSAGRY
jgi:hypothetical protein